MRLDKYLSNSTELTRSQAKKALKARLVTVDGCVVKDGATQITAEQTIRLDDCPVEASGQRYFMLYKPVGYISATKDKNQLTAFELLDEINLDKLHIAGRLDIDSSGLLLITSDGNWSHRITSPKHHCDKRYQVETSEVIAPSAVEKFAEGILLSSESRKTRPAKLEIIDDFNAVIIINEGKYHQVKRMFAAVGNHVDSLHRSSIGKITLDESLREGEYRPLTHDEINSI